MKNLHASDAPPGQSDASSPEAGASMWSPLRGPVFRAVWIAWVVSNTGTWMQNVGAAWLMTTLTPSPLLVALMQTATSLPVFLVGLPAGALADVVDRRKLLLVTQTWMLLAALVLGVLTLAGLASAGILLLFTFLIGLGTALTSPAWNAIIPEIVERQDLALQAVLVRNGVFILGASALWSLLPAMARHELGLDATGYGIVLGSLGLGAVGGALLLPRLRRALSVDTLTATATLVFAGATLALAYVRFVPLMLVSTMAGGLAWLVMLSTLTFSAQTACPAWVRARALAIYLLVFQGMLAVGSLAWGAVAERFGSSTALAFAALALVCGLAAIIRWPLHVVQGRDLSPSGQWPDPKMAMTPDAADGPVLITIEYRVPAERASDFIATMDAMRTFRRREGAISWGIFRDAADPDHYVETFLVLTWGEHMRQHARVTVEDQILEARRNAFLEPGVAPLTSHLIDAHAFDGRTPAEPRYAELS